MARELLTRCIARVCKGEHFAALAPCDLRDNVGGRAEAIQPEPTSIAGHYERTVADEASAEQRRGGRIRVIGRQCKAIAVIGDGVLGIAAIEGVAGETG